ncbi:MAG: outer membrane beta-barrel protein [Mangrovibacterium sp.]
MKRVILVIGILVGVVSSTFAESLVNLGLKAGYVSSSIQVESLDDASIHQFMFGAWGRLNIGERVYVQPELFYLKKGGEELKFDSYNVPVLLGYKLVSDGLFNLRANAGPVFSFVSGIDEDVLDLHYKDNYTAMQFGVGIDVAMLSLDVAMERGGNISDMRDFDANPAIFMVTLAWRFL